MQQPQQQQPPAEDPNAPRVVPKESYKAKVFTSDSVEVGSDAVWAVSSAKHGNGILQLRDDDDGTYWQSDDALPHTISVQFPRLTCVNKVAIQLNSTVDESYTPKKLAVFCGTHPSNAVEVAAAEVENPDGWLILKLSDGLAAIANMATMAEMMATKAASAVGGASKTTDEDDNANAGGGSSTAARKAPIAINESALSASTITGGADDTPNPDEATVWCTYINILITENHQNGRDTHVRGVHVYGPAPPKKYSTTYFDTFDGLR